MKVELLTLFAVLGIWVAVWELSRIRYAAEHPRHYSENR